MPSDGIIGIIGAMDVEVNTLKSVVDRLVTETVAGIEFYSGRINGTEVVIAECGIGKVNAAICTQIMAVKYNVCAIINTGIGGGVGEGLHVGDLVIASGLVQHDFDVSPFGYAKGYMFRGSKDKPSVYETDSELNELIKQAAQGHINSERLKSGIVATGDMFVADRDKKTQISKEFNALVTEMEGGAIAQTATANGIPFTVVRAISDLADGEGCETYEVFEEETAKLSARIIESFLSLWPIGSHIKRGRMNMKRLLTILVMTFCLFSLVGCGDNNKVNVTPSVLPVAREQIINPDGGDLETRINPPKGYNRTTEPDGGFADFLRRYPLKEDSSPVLLYNGAKKGNQNAHAAVFKLPIEEENLQQCADSVMRVYAEYLWSRGEYDKICFHFTDGFAAEYSKWRNGYRIAINADKASWVKSKGYDESYDCFKKYLRMVFSYAGTLSMESEAEKITLDEMQVGDVFLWGGSPGHVVMVCDMCENENGQKAFLLAQGYMPAQEFHVLKNPKHADDPWYYTDEVSYPFVTPEYSFDEGSLKRLCYNR